MKIQKIVQLNNVGKFHNYSCHGSMDFSNVTLIYGENGKGKTTLSTIFRSLKTGDRALLTEKKSAGAQEQLTIKILLENNQVTQFNESSGTWTILNPDLEIFDTYHVNNNVFSGDHVDHTHKKNLYYLVIGDQGVQMAQEIESMDSSIKESADLLKALENQIKASIPSKSPVETFLNLPQIDDLDRKLAKVTADIKELEEASSILSTSSLSQIPFPDMGIQELCHLLEKSLDTVSEEAKSHVVEHCLSLGENAEGWVKQGIDYLKRTSLPLCPFCLQEISQVNTIQHFKSYFTQAYDALKEEINSYYSIFESHFPEKRLIEIQFSLNENNTLAMYWRNYIQFELETIPFNQLFDVRKGILSFARIALSHKSDKPLDIIKLGDGFKELLNSYQKIKASFDIYNHQVESICNLIIEKKKITQEGDLAVTKSMRLALEDTRARYSEEIKPICDTYLSGRGKLAELKSNKQIRSDQLKQYSENIFFKYKSTINDYLAKFGAEFLIVDPKTSLQGGKPSATYMLSINNQVIPLGTTDTVGEPCFRTILSDGDKNSLSFAFYLAQLKLDTDIKNKTLVIDDPITSLDIHRKNRTFQEIKEISNLVKQTIVLSHDAHFLKLFWDSFMNVKTYQIKRDGNQSIICEWDIQNETLPSYLQDYFRLDHYLSESDNDLRGVVRCIRPLLEGNLRFRFPKSFGTKEWLGDFIEKIRVAQPGSNLARIQPLLGELSVINSYSSRYHHQQNPLADNEEIFDTELTSYVTRTLSLLNQI